MLNTWLPDYNQCIVRQFEKVYSTGPSTAVRKCNSRPSHKDNPVPVHVRRQDELELKCITRAPANLQGQQSATSYQVPLKIAVSNDTAFGEQLIGLCHPFGFRNWNSTGFEFLHWFQIVSMLEHNLRNAQDQENRTTQ